MSIRTRLLPTSRRVRWALALALVLAAVTLTIAAFWFQSWRAQREFEATVAMIEGKGGKVTVGYDVPRWREPLNRSLGFPLYPEVGPRGVAVELDNTEVTAADLERVAAMSNLMSLHLNQTRGVDDESLKSLRNATSLMEIQLNGTQVTDAGLHVFADLPCLSRFCVGDTAVTDEGVGFLSQLPSRGLIGVYATGAQVNAVEPRELSLTNANGQRNIKLGDKLKVCGGFGGTQDQVSYLNAGVFVTEESDPEWQKVKINGFAPPKLDTDGDFEFEITVNGTPTVPGRYVGTVNVYCKHPNALVIYRLGKVKFEVKPTPAPTK